MCKVDDLGGAVSTLIYTLTAKDNKISYKCLAHPFKD